MATSGKKGKKTKGTVISLQSFLSNGDSSTGITRVTKKIRNIDGDDSDDGNNSLQVVYQLPTAPRATRALDEDLVPHKAPYIAYITNLPFDIHESDIFEFFDSNVITSLRLPREDSECGRVRGFGYVEFETRQDLIHVLGIPDPTIKGRRIRIELSNEHEQQNNRQKNGRRGFDSFGNDNFNESRDSVNWRRDGGQNFGNVAGSNFFTSSDRGTVRERHHSDVKDLSSWRSGNRTKSGNTSRSYQDPDIYFNTSSNKIEDNANSNKNDLIQERPKLNLKPRTLPLPTKSNIEIDNIEFKKHSNLSVTHEKVFGSAKPVDTAAREQELEERLFLERRQDNSQLGSKSNECSNINKKLASVHLDAPQKDNINSSLNWRSGNIIPLQSDDSTNSEKQSSYDITINLKRDNHHFVNYEKDPQLDSKNNRIDSLKMKQQKDSKEGEEVHVKYDKKNDKSLQKCTPNVSKTIFQSSNKYFGLDDEISE